MQYTIWFMVSLAQNIWKLQQKKHLRISVPFITQVAFHAKKGLRSWEYANQFLNNFNLIDTLSYDILCRSLWLQSSFPVRTYRWQFFLSEPNTVTFLLPSSQTIELLILEDKFHSQRGWLQFGSQSAQGYFRLFYPFSGFPGYCYLSSFSFATGSVISVFIVDIVSSFWNQSHGCRSLRRCDCL